MSAPAYDGVYQRYCVRRAAFWLPWLACGLCLYWLAWPANLLAGVVALGGLLAVVQRTTAQAASWLSVPPDRRALTGHASAHNRVLDHAQSHPEGRDYWNVMLPDGAMLNGVVGAIHAIDDGRLHIALELHPLKPPMLVCDSVVPCIYTITHTRGEVRAAALFDHVLAHPAQAAQLVHDACRHTATLMPLQRVHDLLVPFSGILAPAPMLPHRLSCGALLEAHLLLPADLRAACDPPTLLASPVYQLALDGNKLDLRVASLAGLQASAHGQCWVVPGLLQAGMRRGRGVWQIWYRGRWHAMRDMASFVDGGDLRYNVYMTLVSVGDDGVLHCSLTTFDVTAQGFSARGVPATVALDVSWSRCPLLLVTRDGQIKVQLPAGSSW